MSKMIAGTRYTWTVMALNLITSVAIVWCNKIATNNGFRWIISLTAFHFACTFVGLLLVSKINMFTPAKTPIRNMLPICFAFIGFVVFNNLSLKYNSVGLYQLMKVMTSPVICVLQYVLHNVTVPFKELLALLPVCIGVALATVTTVYGSPDGFLYGILGIFSTSFYQVWVKSEQKALALNSYQLLYLQSPISFFMLLGVIPFLEPDYMDIFNFHWVTVKCLLAVIASGILAALVNISIFLVISETSPLSYNVLGHTKLCTIISSGYLIFGDQFEARPFLGVILAVVGIMYYTHLRAIAGQQSKKEEEKKIEENTQNSQTCKRTSKNTQNEQNERNNQNDETWMQISKNNQNEQDQTCKQTSDPFRGDGVTTGRNRAKI